MEKEKVLMDTNGNINKIIENIIQCFEISNVKLDHKVEKIKQIIYLFGYNICEEQKKLCAENADVVLYDPSYPDDSLYYKLEADEVYVNKESILNTPNVCQK